MLEPPSLPAAGWYPDPHSTGYERYWNGHSWADRRRPSGRGAPAGDELPDVGGWLARAFRRTWLRWRAIVVVSLCTAVASSLLFLVTLDRLVDDLVLTSDEELIGWTNDRLPIAVSLGAIAIALSVIGTLAMTALMLRAVDDTPVLDDADAAGAGGTLDQTAAAFGAALRSIPRAIGWTIAAIAMLLAIPFGIVAIAVISPILLVLAVLAAIPVTVWLVVRWAFVFVAIVDGPGNPFSRSATVVKGRWWAVFWRFALLGLVVWGISLAVNTVASILGGNGTSGAFGGGPAIELDADQQLTGDVSLSDFVPTDWWAVTVGTTAALVLNVVTAIGFAAAAELYRTRHR